MALDFPVIYLLPAHLGPDLLADLTRRIPTLTQDANKAEVFIGKISRKERALLELQCRRIESEELTPDSQPTAKKRRLHAPRSSQESESETTSEPENPEGGPSNVKVVKLSWFTDSVERGAVLPVEDYLIYEGRKITPRSQSTKTTAAFEADKVLRRAQADATSSSQLHNHHDHSHSRTRGSGTRRPPLLTEFTSEEAETVPPVPAYLHTVYSCQRPTPRHPPNEAFIRLLEEIRTVRTLQGDGVGVRAYSTSIAALGAYPSTLSNAAGCGSKIAALFQEYKENGYLREVRETETDAQLSVLKLFYNIWGVGEVTAREFYNKGWRHLDDIVEYGWDSLSRVQQIGVKYYDEFLLKIPRPEVEDIAQTILNHANRINGGFQMVIVGGYRRGKEDCGDVDVILSHPNEAATDDVIGCIVDSLEEDEFVTRILSLSTKNSERGQNPLKDKDAATRSGFDNLDKAMVVWQNPRWTTGEARNPNPHRRVDIIISPWKTAGCAVLGWTGATTFERDIRRYCAKERNLKFDSTGICSKIDGSWVDMESGPDGSPAPDMLTAERRIFENLGLEWREPWERCTG